MCALRPGCGAPVDIVVLFHLDLIELRLERDRVLIANLIGHLGRQVVPHICATRIEGSRAKGAKGNAPIHLAMSSWG
jgi:hypothetical protein